MSEDIHLKNIEKRIRAVELLRLLKKTHTYDNLSKATGLPITVLNRYVKGHILPKTKRAEELLRTFSNERELQKEISKRIKFDSRGYFDNTALL
ncbi:MAG: adenine phosphoribosyltransferase, partial [Promethearchaeota archaeon]